MRRGLVIIAVVGLLLCGGLGVTLWQWRSAEKDRRDLSDLTMLSPWPRTQLLLPDGLPLDRAMGDVGSAGLSVSYVTEDGPLAYAIEVLDDRGEPVWGVSCGARAVAVCTDLGGGYTYVKVLDTGNSDPATIVRRRDGDRIFSATLLGDHPDRVTDLRAVVTAVHQPSDAELLKILRFDGYQTDWS
ncbi:hypothetical protein [Hamadaea tsunoensis]|uniref:hypothetical protein n=1 Tax=Hamadaea tsunoensis TaxID=53368 RepID=UPI000480DFF3|nr:hypothetical protein [Hamadaea tsunoensis]